MPLWNSVAEAYQWGRARATAESLSEWKAYAHELEQELRDVKRRLAQKHLALEAVAAQRAELIAEGQSCPCGHHPLAHSKEERDRIYDEVSNKVMAEYNKDPAAAHAELMKGLNG